MEFIEFLDDHARGHALTRCVVLPEMEKDVACGGFAVEYLLLSNGSAKQFPDDKRDISKVVFHNATNDREDFWERKLGGGEAFTEAEDREFMNYAIKHVVPIVTEHISEMREVVRELCIKRRLDGKRIQELLRFGAST